MHGLVASIYVHLELFVVSVAVEKADLILWPGVLKGDRFTVFWVYCVVLSSVYFSCGAIFCLL